MSSEKSIYDLFGLDNLSRDSFCINFPQLERQSITHCIVHAIDERALLTTSLFSTHRLRLSQSSAPVEPLALVLVLCSCVQAYLASYNSLIKVHIACGRAGDTDTACQLMSSETIAAVVNILHSSWIVRAFELGLTIPVPRVRAAYTSIGCRSHLE